MDESQSDQIIDPGATDTVDYVVWEAYLEMDDGRMHVVHQKDIYNEELEFRPSYEELPRDKLRLFRMVAVDSGRCLLQLPFKPGQGGRLIWRRRRQLQPGVGETWFYIVGKRGAFINLIMPDFSIVSDDNFSEDNVLLNDIDPVAGEEG